MADSALDHITDALQRIGSYAPSETLTDADAERCLSALNDMIDSWSNESLSVYARTENSVVLTPNKYQYTIGTGGDINVTRPLSIIGSYGTAYILDSNGNRYPMDVLNQEQWNLIGNVAQVNANIPSKVFYDPQFPLGILNLFPVPTLGWTFYFDSWLQLSEFADLVTNYPLPPGYRRAIRTNLALEFWPYFKAPNAQPGTALVRAAMQSLGNIKRTNSNPPVAVYDPEIISRASSTYNIFRDRQG